MKKTDFVLLFSSKPCISMSAELIQVSKCENTSVMQIRDTYLLFALFESNLRMNLLKIKRRVLKVLNRA